MRTLAPSAGAVELHGGLQLGYSGGTGGKADVLLSDFAQGLPLRLRFAVGYATLDPGSPADARRIFIKDATNGIPEEHGRVWDFGLEGRFPMGPTLEFVLGGGIDWYRDAELRGHDTSYAPDGEDVNPRDDYDYDDADDAIEQPGLEPRLLIGMSYRFGL